MEAAQQAVLGAMLIKPSIVGEILAEVRDEDFVSPTHRMTFQVIRTLFSEGKKPDPIVVLHRLGASDQQPWREYIIDLMDRTPTAANVWEYVPILKEQAKLYHLRLLGERLAQAGSLDDAAKCMADGNAMMVDKPGLRYVTMEQALLDFYDRHKTRKEYLTWGLDKLNDRLFVDRGDMVVLGGYASAGKTLLAIQFAWHWAKLGRKVGFYSLETGAGKLEDRLIAHNMRLDFGKIKRSELIEDDYKALAMASKRLIQPTLEWVPASGMTVDEIRSSALSRGYDAIFIDYLQLIQGDKRRSRAEEVAGISIGLHQLSQSTGITVVALSQLSRPEKGGDGVKAPTLASLRESGQIEQDADVAMLLYKEEDTPHSRRILHIAKNKEGETGKIYLAFDGAHQRLYESVVDAPAPRKRREPEYKQVQFTEIMEDPDDPFREKGDQHGQSQSGPAAAAGDPAPGGPGTGQQLPSGSPAGGPGADSGSPGSGGGSA
ncbi:replicative DNA helicase [Flavonifractor sp. An9]|uniref:replicative DNA helicase n=1 Tax=Flavonifractor sp. An9 TaxID=1965664 RepID=UPI0023B90F49|nr:DnaB-like helicase C-terminal domain-containing protein [Flavonifractor sp. An9]